MLIEMFTESLPPDYRWTPSDDFKRGTTEFYIETAKNLSTLGHDVIVYYDGVAAHVDGITYLPHSAYVGSDALLACNARPPKLARRNVYWTNLFDERAGDFQDFDAIINISEYQKSVFGSEKVHVIGHGCYPERYEGASKDGDVCLYSSSPDRGQALLEMIWPRVEKETGAKLITAYGRFTEDEMDKLYKAARYWLHPGEGVELFCISALKAQAAGCIPVVVPNMALESTVKYGVRTTKERFADDLINAIKFPPPVPKIHIPSWLEVTKQIEELLK